MESKDTVIHADGCTTNLGIIGATCNCGAERQDEISFKAGERKVMKFIEKRRNACLLNEEQIDCRLCLSELLKALTTLMEEVKKNET